MSSDQDTSVEIMGKIYQIKCPPNEVASLNQAAAYLEEKMTLMRESGVFSLDRVAIITALNIVHQLLSLEQLKNQHFQNINERIGDLSGKVDAALTKFAQMELYPAE